MNFTIGRYFIMIDFNLKHDWFYRPTKWAILNFCNEFSFCVFKIRVIVQKVTGFRGIVK